MPHEVTSTSRTLKERKQYTKVGLDMRLNSRVIDLRILTNQAIFRIQSVVSMLFRKNLEAHDFIEIHTPKLLAEASEGQSLVFTLDYEGQQACLAQSSQLHKQMGMCVNFGRVFEVGPYFKAENSLRIAIFVSLPASMSEMEIKEHYFEVISVVDELFVSTFDRLTHRCKSELQAINQQHSFEPLKYREETLRLSFEEGVQMLQEAGGEVDPLGDLTTEVERKLGQLVKEKDTLSLRGPCTRCPRQMIPDTQIRLMFSSKLNVESDEGLPHVSLMAVDALHGRKSSQDHNVFIIQTFSQNVHQNAKLM